MSGIVSQFRNPHSPREARSLASAAALCLCITVVALSAASAAEPLPFAVGERLTYTVRVWLGDNSFGLDVGTAEFAVDRVPAETGDAYQFEINA